MQIHHHMLLWMGSDIPAPEPASGTEAFRDAQKRLDLHLGEEEGGPRAYNMKLDMYLLTVNSLTMLVVIAHHIGRCYITI